MLLHNKCSCTLVKQEYLLITCGKCLTNTVLYFVLLKIIVVAAKLLDQAPGFAMDES